MLHSHYTCEIGEALGDYGDGTDGTPTHLPMAAFFTAVFYFWMDVTVVSVQALIFLLIRFRWGSSDAQCCHWSGLGHTRRHRGGWLRRVLGCPIFDAPLPRSQWSVKSAFIDICHGLCSLPHVLVIYSIIFFCVCYGYTAYSSNKGPFFGFEVYGGTANRADACGENCTQAQMNYNEGVGMAGGCADHLTNIVGYLYTWTMPFIIKLVGARTVITVALVFQGLLIALAYMTSTNLAVFFVVILSLTQATFFAMLVPVIIHVMGNDIDIGCLGVVNSANYFGQLVNYVIGTAIVNTSLGYTLPALVGGIVSAIGFFVSLAFFRIDMRSM